VRKVVDQIKSSVNALQSLFNALLDISRLEAGVMKVDKGDFHLQPLLDKLANEYELLAAEKDLRLVISSCDFVAHSDASLIEQILRNYLSNAIRYTDQGEVSINCSATNDTVKIRVSDTGCGIPHNEQKAVFQEFHQLHNPERDRSKGLGLGLAIVQRSAKLLQHRIGLESEPGKGSTFWIDIDRGSAISNSAVTSTETTTETSMQPAHKPFLVVIDDEVSVLDGTRQLLETWNCEVITAMDLSSALKQLEQHDQKPDAIIADYRLCDNQTGIEAITAIHAHYGTMIPALIVTGDIAAEPLREVSLSGFQVMHKPVAPAKLRAFIRHLQR
jgi:CheY-like chemotaxis protein/anti-sigma regulatory factor (Ser/Thr protein kinase)